MFILMIRERRDSWAGRGPITTSHASREEAEADLVSYVRECWQDKMHGDPPEDEDDLVNLYFGKALEEFAIGESV